MDPSIFSVTGVSEGSRAADLHSLRGLGGRLRCPPAVVITHDQDVFNPSGVNPSGEAVTSGSRCQGTFSSSSLSLSTADGRNGLYGSTVATPSRSGSPRHSKIHPTEGTSQTDQSDHHIQRKANRCRCCSARAKRTTIGFFLTVISCANWIGIIHLLKWAYVIHLNPFGYTGPNGTFASSFHTTATSVPDDAVTTTLDTSSVSFSEDISADNATDTTKLEPFRAPFFTIWVCTAFNCLFFPAYVCVICCSRRKRMTTKKAFLGAIHRFQEKGLSALHFFTRSMFFCILWVAANYMFIHSLTTLDPTAVMALQASSASFVYLLSWVILHEQFVGIRIVAVILCNTGIALLAYMDGVSRTSTLGGVVLAAAAAAGLAVHKVLFKKLIGSVTMGQLSLFLTLVGLLNILLLWPIGLTLYFVETEILIWTQMPYAQLAGASALIIFGNVLMNFEMMHTYDTFLKLGTVSAVPVSAVLDVYLYNVVFQGMKLAGVLVISIGFLLVLLPDNWPDYITKILRWRWRRGKEIQISKPPEIAQPRSRLRASSGNIKQAKC